MYEDSNMLSPTNNLKDVIEKKKQIYHFCGEQFWDPEILCHPFVVLQSSTVSYTMKQFNSGKHG